eukprot:1158027-Pelagomonas_calceolata.AAC.14
MKKEVIKRKKWGPGTAPWLTQLNGKHNFNSLHTAPCVCAASCAGFHATAAQRHAARPTQGNTCRAQEDGTECFVHGLRKQGVYVLCTVSDKTILRCARTACRG